MTRKHNHRIALLAVIIVTALVSLWSTSSEPTRRLFNNQLSPDDGLEIENRLRVWEISYEVRDGALLIPTSKWDEINSRLLREGYPRGIRRVLGVPLVQNTFETQAQQKVRAQNELETHLQNILESFPEVDEAYVKLAIPGLTYSHKADNMGAARVLVNCNSQIEPKILETFSRHLRAQFPLPGLSHLNVIDTQGSVLFEKSYSPHHEKEVAPLGTTSK